MTGKISTHLTLVLIFVASCAGPLSGASSVDADLDEIVDHLIEAGYPPDDLRIVESVVYAGRDAAVSLQASREMIGVPGSGQEQYRTNNLVSSTIQTIIIVGHELPPVYSNALEALSPCTTHRASESHVSTSR